MAGLALPRGRPDEKAPTPSALRLRRRLPSLRRPVGPSRGHGSSVALRPAAAARRPGPTRSGAPCLASPSVPVGTASPAVAGPQPGAAARAFDRPTTYATPSGSFASRATSKLYDHPLQDTDMEEIYEAARRSGVRLVHPFCDLDVLALRYRARTQRSRPWRPPEGHRAGGTRAPLPGPSALVSTRGGPPAKPLRGADVQRRSPDPETPAAHDRACRARRSRPAPLRDRSRTCCRPSRSAIRQQSLGRLDSRELGAVALVNEGEPPFFEVVLAVYDLNFQLIAVAPAFVAPSGRTLKFDGVFVRPQ